VKKELVVLFLLVFGLVIIPTYAQDETMPKCQNVKVTIEHEDVAITLTFNISPTIVTKGDGTKRCSTKAEIFDVITRTFPHYRMKRDIKLGKQT